MGARPSEHELTGVLKEGSLLNRRAGGQPRFDLPPAVPDGTVTAPAEDDGMYAALSQPATDRRPVDIEEGGQRLEADGEAFFS